MKRYNYPWSHYVIDNFFPKDLFTMLCQESISANMFLFDGTRNNIENRCFITKKNKYSLGLRLEQFYNNFLQNSNIFSHLQLCKFRIEIANDVGDYFIKPHLDSLNKLITIITYVNGHPNLGTELYTNCNSKGYVVNWKENRSLIFIPSKNTWHGVPQRSFKGKRRIIIFNCVDKDWNCKDQLW